MKLAAKAAGIELRKDHDGNDYYHFDLGPKRFLNEVPSQQQTLLLGR